MAPRDHVRIFLVDDDEDDRDLFRVALEKVNKNAVLHFAAYGVQALEYLNNTQEMPHFVFLDINMPLLDGMECLRRIRVVHPMELLPVVMLSTSGASNLVHECLTLGANQYLQKPSSLERLCDQIRSCLEKVEEDGSALTDSRQ